MAFSSILDPVLGWVLYLPLWLGLLVLSILLTLIINLVYKYATDQKEMKRLKAKIKSFQKEMKEHRSDAKRMKKIQKEAMATNMQYTTKSLKPTLYTLLPLLIIFAWMNANLAYDIAQPGDTVDIHVTMKEPSRLVMTTELTLAGAATKETIERETSFRVSSDSAGTFPFSIQNQDNLSVAGSVMFGETPVITPIPVENPYKEVNVKYGKATPFGDFAIFNYKPGWLFTYIIFSIAFSLLTRKLMGIA